MANRSEWNRNNICSQMRCKECESRTRREYNITERRETQTGYNMACRMKKVDDDDNTGDDLYLILVFTIIMLLLWPPIDNNSSHLAAGKPSTANSQTHTRCWHLNWENRSAFGQRRYRCSSTKTSQTCATAVLLRVPHRGASVWMDQETTMC